MSRPFHPDSQPQYPRYSDGPERLRNRPDRVKGNVSYVHDYREGPSPGPSNSRARSKGNTPFVSGFLLILLFALFVSVSFYGGVIFGRGGKTAQTNQAAAPARQKPLPPEAMTQLNDAMAILRNGDPSKALQELQNLTTLHPHTPSLFYATAIAALTSENIELAGTMAESCAAWGYRKSDALALLANIELAKASRSESPSFADPNLRAKDFLTQAIEADPLNPGPHIELAAISRRLGHAEEAVAHLEHGKNLVFPVDTIVVTETTLAILRDESPVNEPEMHIPPFAQAVRSASAGDLPRAALLFADCRRHLPEETYAFLIGDPAVRKYINQPELKDIFAGR